LIGGLIGAVISAVVGYLVPLPRTPWPTPSGNADQRAVQRLLRRVHGPDRRRPEGAPRAGLTQVIVRLDALRMSGSE
jgi:hypothetical protein